MDLWSVLELSYSSKARVTDPVQRLLGSVPVFAQLVLELQHFPVDVSQRHPDLIVIVERWPHVSTLPLQVLQQGQQTLQIIVLVHLPVQLILGIVQAIAQSVIRSLEKEKETQREMTSVYVSSRVPTDLEDLSEF